MMKISNKKRRSAHDVLTEFRRREILDAAYVLASSEGFYNLTVERVAEKAGVSKGTIYTYFKDKADLVLVLVREVAELLLNDIEKASKLDGAIHERLLKMADVLDDCIDQHRELLFYIHQPNDLNRCVPGIDDSAMRSVLIRIIGAVSAIVADGQKQGVIIEGDPKVYALVLLSTFHNLLDTETYLPDVKININARYLMNLFLNGIRKKEE